MALGWEWEPEKDLLAGIEALALDIVGVVGIAGAVEHYQDKDKALFRWEADRRCNFLLGKEQDLAFLLVLLRQFVGILLGCCNLVYPYLVVSAR